MHDRAHDTNRNTSPTRKRVLFERQSFERPRGVRHNSLARASGLYRLTLGSLAVAVALIGCRTTEPVTHVGDPHAAGAISDGSDAAGTDACPPERYEDQLTGGRVFQMYCGACHNARALGERPFASYENATNHMRVRANLTGEEYRKLMVFLRYWHDVPPQTPPNEPSPKRFIFSQPISELRPEPAAPPQDVVPPEPQPKSENSPDR